MADLSAVLRKTIDGLPNATPELRAKVYDKARAAIIRQIENANPPLSDDVIDMRRHALEEAIRTTEAHYGVENAPPRPAVALPPAAAGAAGQAAWPRQTETPSPAEPMRMPRVEMPFAGAPSVESERRRPAPVAEAAPRRVEPRLSDRSVGIGTTEPDGGFDIPDADTSAPRYSPQRVQRRTKSRAPLAAAAAAILVVGALGTAGYVYRDEITGMMSGSGATASAPAGTEDMPADTDVAALPPSTSGNAASAGGDAAAPSATQPGSKRRFTQRLRPDGTEVDEGPAAGNPNAFDEGTNIAAATPEPTPAAPAAPAVAVPPATPPQTAAIPPASNVPAVGQKAMFYEERTESQQGTQQAGNVVWSLVNESPAEGQPPEPAIRAVADVKNIKFKMTMTIRRNLDPTLPASHVIELQFDVPPAFEGGQVANVQRLALKPSEEARGDPLIGVAGKISDGFFIIALNNLDKATETNLALLGSQEWIDIPIAYATGRRALMSIEKGVPGDRVFKQALDAWAAKT